MKYVITVNEVKDSKKEVQLVKDRYKNKKISQYIKEKS